MAAVLAQVAGEPTEPPSERFDVDLHVSHGERQQQRLLRAHEMLLELSDENREQFGELVETLRTELKPSS